MFFSVIAGTGEIASSTTFPHESGRPIEPRRRIGPVVGLLRGLDVVEKAPIDNGVPCGSDWGKQGRSACGVRTGNRFAPLLQPVCPHGVNGVPRNWLKKCG